MSEDKREKFGSRTLTEKDDVFKHNAWDHAEWSDEQLKEAKAKVEKDIDFWKSGETSILEKGELPFSESWHKFYSNHDDKFFKNRNRHVGRYRVFEIQGTYETKRLNLTIKR